MKQHPCHKEQVASLKRIEGQIRGIQKMIDDQKYCVDILNQIKAVKNSITTVEGKILKKHLNECIKESFSKKDSCDEKIEEIVKLLKR
tara:strand:+ start:1166 stop:1429 length:264 start_codon:yes stop_codon:yes gene_type:complete